ncbi:circularly permuted type 2 ATP-grasp protein [Nocardioides stalactiti]|uniref:circularly permuted type 2 ATP-grasp protein n=1 Tax=Nocardioides stalactiti TaxID=2755356 RepID=UPI0016003465|nr:circularly permuted type 2 ATP-grasp protein [Nocardioides stalactiti]
MTATPDDAIAASPLEDYRHRVTTRPGGRDGAEVPDEVFRAGGASQDLVAAAVGALGMSGLLTARAEARRLIDADGIRYGAAEDGGQARDWIVDPLPVVLGSAEWLSLERSLEQRALVLDAVLGDLYGARTLLRRGVVPPEVVLGHPGFLRQADGIRLPGRRQLVLTGTDLGRDSDGNWVAFGDRLGAPSGAGYAMATRRITSRLLPGLHRSTRLARMRPFFHTMTHALREAAPVGVHNPQVVLLSPGSGSETAYDQSFLATLLGFPLVEAEDLVVREGRVWIRSTNRSDAVDVVLRRVDADFADPLELRPDSRLGLPGLLEASRRGTVAVANPLGAGVLENPGVAHFLPAVSRALFGEEPALPGASSYWCGDPAERSHVLAHLQELVIKPIARGRSISARPGWELTAEERELTRRRIEAEPWAWVAQEPLTMSTVPVVTPHGLESRRFVLRTFGVARGEGYHFLPGGLGRVAPDEASYLIANAAGALAKDVWVLASDETGTSWSDDRLLDLRPPLASEDAAALAPRAASALYWVGRYAERAEATARVIRVVDDLVEDHASWPGTPGAAAVQVMVDGLLAMTSTTGRSGAEPPDQVLRRLVGDQRRPGSVAFAVAGLVRGAQDVRDHLSYDIWHVLNRIERALDDEPAEDRPLQPQLYRVLESMLAVHGVIAENMVRDESWGYLDGGLRLERALLTTALVRAAVAQERPPIIDGQVTEAALEACDSIITHRRRVATGEGPAWPVHSAVELLLRDPANPRSVAFSVERLVERFQLIGAPVLAAEGAELLALFRDMDVDRLCADDRSGLLAACDQVTQSLRGMSDRLTASHFRRKPTQQVVPADWAVARIGDT